MENIQPIHFLISIGIAIAFIGYMLSKIENNFIKTQIRNEVFQDDIVQLLKEQNEIQQDILNSIQRIQPDIEEIKYVSNLVERYKIPSESEQKAIDDIALDNKLFNS